MRQGIFCLFALACMYVDSSCEIFTGHFWYYIHVQCIFHFSETEKYKFLSSYYRLRFCGSAEAKTYVCIYLALNLWWIRKVIFGDVFVIRNVLCIPHSLGSIPILIIEIVPFKVGIQLPSSMNMLIWQVTTIFYKDS